MDFTDYYFVDEQRLDSYFEQISNPVKYDKVPVWKAGLSLLGVKVEETQNRTGRPFTMHEKMQKILKYAKDNDLLKCGRLEHPADATSSPFRIESMSARPAIIQANETLGNQNDITVWVSLKPDENEKCNKSNGALFLLENYSGDDTKAPFTISAYSWLTMLAKVVSEKPSEDFSLNDVKLKGALMIEGLKSKFASNPVGALVELGAIFAPERRISALYKVRASCYSRELESSVTTIGYPIVVTGDEGLLNEFA